MSMTTVVIFVVLILTAGLGIAAWNRRKRKRAFFASHSIDPEQLHAILFGTNETNPVQVLDVRQPLDLLAYSEIIPGSRRIPPKEILESAELLLKDHDTVVYCTCPSDETAGKIMQKAVSLGFAKVKVLRGGLNAWKAKNYPTHTGLTP